MRACLGYLEGKIMHVTVFVDAACFPFKVTHVDIKTRRGDSEQIDIGLRALHTKKKSF